MASDSWREKKTESSKLAWPAHGQDESARCTLGLSFWSYPNISTLEKKLRGVFGALNRNKKISVQKHQLRRKKNPWS